MKATEQSRDTAFLRWTRAVATIVLVLGLVVIPAAWYGAVLPLKQEVGFDMHFAYAPAARDVLDRTNPYPADLDGAEVVNEHAYAYPPLLAFATVPFTVVSDETAGFIGAGLALLAAAMILFLLGIRDWRCYGAALAWAPTYNAVQNANVSILIALALALAWRWRDRVWRPGAALGLSIALKPFAAPLLLWPLAMRRTRTALAGATVAAVAVLVPWALIGFAGLTDYPALLRRLEELESLQSYSAYSALVGVDVPTAIATALTLVAGAALAVACVIWGRRGDDRRSLTAAVAFVLVVSPLVWQHYYTMLLVPVALAWPTLSVAWLLPLVLWGTGVAGDGNAFQTMLAAATMALVVILCLRRGVPARQRELEVAWLPRQLTPVEARR